MRYKTSYKYLFLVWWVITTLLFLMPPDQLPELNKILSIEKHDKIIHIIIFFVYSYLIYKISFKTYIAFIASLIFVLAYAIIIELLQPFVNRGFDLYDYVASIVGVLITYFSIYLYKLIKLIIK